VSKANPKLNRRTQAQPKICRGEELLRYPALPLERIFAPEAVALIGAREKAGSVGRTIFENFEEAGSKVLAIPSTQNAIGLHELAPGFEIVLVEFLFRRGFFEMLVQAVLHFFGKELHDGLKVAGLQRLVASGNSRAKVAAGGFEAGIRRAFSCALNAHEGFEEIRSANSAASALSLRTASVFSKAF
jgi:hypothetical protein